MRPRAKKRTIGGRPATANAVKRRAKRRAPYRGNYFYRDAQKLSLVKVPDTFALRLREGRLPAQVGAWARERVAPVALAQAYGAKRLATYRVPAPARDRTMEALRRDPRTQYCTHVYRRKGATVAEPLVLTEEIVVQFQKGHSRPALHKLCRERGMELVESVPGLANGYLCRVTAAAGENALKVANRLIEEDLALAAEPPQRFGMSSSPLPTRWTRAAAATMPAAGVPATATAAPTPPAPSRRRNGGRGRGAGRSSLRHRQWRDGLGWIGSKAR